MSCKPFVMALLYSFFLLTGSVYGIGEKILTLGSASSWENVEKKQGIIEVANIRPNSVLVLDSSMPFLNNEAYLDLHLSFDDSRPFNFKDSKGRYDVLISPELGVVSEPLCRIGTGAALFSFRSDTTENEGPLVLKPRANALFAPGSHIRDFSIEFWLFPQNLETGEQLLTWISSKPDGKGGFVNQRIQCIASRNKLNWTFGNIFFSPGERENKIMSFSGPLLLNRTWSHHLIRFDADLGLLEYLVDGRLEVVDYTTSTGREGGEVYTPVIGDDCRLVLGSRFSGIIDEFRIYSCYVEKTALTKYPDRGGRVETRTLDLGYTNSRVLKIEAFGGRTGVFQTRVRNEYTGNSTLRFTDHAEIKFFIRTSNSPYRWNDIPWLPFNPGTDLSGSLSGNLSGSLLGVPGELRGRYIQIAADFYPSGNGETSPYLSELKITYNSADPPPPPVQIIAAAKDGAVELTWRASPSRDVGGYYVYYGTTRGEYFEAKSPIDAGSRTSILIDGLNNGTLYYFAVAAYNMPDTREQYFVPEPGEFSREAAARPLRMLQ